MVLLEIKDYIVLLQSRRMLLQNTLHLAVHEQTKREIEFELKSIDYNIKKYNIILNNGAGNEMLQNFNERQN